MKLKWEKRLWEVEFQETIYLLQQKLKPMVIKAHPEELTDRWRNSVLTIFDLILIHWPTGDNIGTYRALEDALNEGKCRAIGLSNFNSQQFSQIIEECDVRPAVNQIETHIMWQQKRMHKFLSKNDCIHESWSPFSSGSFNMFNDETVLDIANNHDKTPAQIILRFLIQNDIVVIPKSSSKDRMKENLDVFDFDLNRDEIFRIRNLDKNQSYCNWPYSMQYEAVNP